MTSSRGVQRLRVPVDMVCTYLRQQIFGEIADLHLFFREVGA